MRSTVRIDDDLMVELKERAAAASMSLTRMLRIGLRTPVEQAGSLRMFEQNAYRMGSPRVGIDKRMALAAELEDEEVARNLLAETGTAGNLVTDAHRGTRHHA